MQTQLEVGAGYGGVGESSLSIVASANISSVGELVNFIITNANSPCYVQEVKLVGSHAGVAPANISTITFPGGNTNKISSVIIVPDQEADFQARLMIQNDVDDDECVLLAKRIPSILSFETPAKPDGTNGRFYLKWGGVGLDRLTVGSVDPALNTLYINGTTAAKCPVGTRVYLESLVDGNIPGGLLANELYYILTAVDGGVGPPVETGNLKVTLSTSLNGSPIDITSAGSNNVISTRDTFRLIWL
jgi:hypothetical protein